MVFLWPLNDREKNIFQLPEGMYFIGDLTYVYMNVDELGDGIDDEDIFNEKIITDLDKTVGSYSNIDTGIYTDWLGGDGVFEDQDGNLYGVDSGTIGICRVDEKLVPNIVSGKNDEWWKELYLMFYKEIIVKVEKEDISIFKPRSFSELKQMGKFIYFHNDFNVEFTRLSNDKGIKNIKFGNITINIADEIEIDVDVEYEEYLKIKEELLAPFMKDYSLLGLKARTIQRWNERGDFDEALIELNALIENNPMKETFYLKGLYQSYLFTTKDLPYSDLETGIKDLDKSIQIDPNWYLPYLARSKAFLSIGESGKAQIDQVKANQLKEQQNLKQLDLHL